MRLRHAAVVTMLFTLVPMTRVIGAEAITIETGRTRDGTFTLAGRDAWQQLIVTGNHTDLTRTATFEASPTGIVEVDKTGLVTPLKEGRAVIRARRAAVNPVPSCWATRRWSFRLHSGSARQSRQRRGGGRAVREGGAW